MKNCNVAIKLFAIGLIFFLLTKESPAPVGGGGINPAGANGLTDVQLRASPLHTIIDSSAALSVTGTFWQATQPVSGTFWQATQPVSLVSMPSTPVTGTFWQATQPVSGTFWQATQPVSLSTNTPDVTDRSGRLLGHVTVDSAPTTAVTGTFWQATQPVSGTFWQATQPVSGTVTANIGTSGSLALDASVTGLEVSQGSTTSGEKGTLTLAAVTTNAPTYTTAQTSPLSIDPSGLLRVSLKDTPQNTNKLLVTPDSVALPANQSVNVSQVNGATTVTSVTGVLNTMPNKRTGTTGLAPNYTATHITTATTTTLTSSTAYISVIQINVSTAGASSTITIKNKEGTAKIVAQVSSAAIGNFTFSFAEPILMTSGIDITSIATAPTADVFITYWQ